MNGKYIPAQRITPQEAIRLFDFATSYEMTICKELYEEYRRSRGRDKDYFWDLMSVCCFCYDTGRVQGIREERAKHRTGKAAEA